MALMMVWVSVVPSNAARVMSDDVLPVPTDTMYVELPGDVPRLESEQEDGTLSYAVVSGAIVYFEVENAVRSSDLSGLRAMIRYDGSDTTVYTPTIVYKKVYDSSGNESLGFRYLVAMDTSQIVFTESSYLLKGELVIGERWMNTLEKQHFEIEIRDSSLSAVDNTVLYLPNSPTFSGIDNGGNVSISFDEGVSFEVDAEGQNEVNITYITYRPDVVASFPDDELSVYSWTHAPVFDRKGTLYIEAEEGMFFYRLSESELIDLTESYDSENQAFTLETRMLETYVMSVKPLSETELGWQKGNPTVGAVL